MTRNDVDQFASRLDKVFSKFSKRHSNATTEEGQARGDEGESVPRNLDKDEDEDDELL